MMNRRTDAYGIRSRFCAWGDDKDGGSGGSNEGEGGKRKKPKYFLNVSGHLFSGGGFPSSGGDLDGEVGWGEEGEDNGGYVVATVVHALAEYPHDFLES